MRTTPSVSTRSTRRSPRATPIVHPGRRAGDEPQVARIVGSLAAAENVHHLPLRGFVQLVHLVQIHGRTGDELPLNLERRSGLLHTHAIDLDERLVAPRTLPMNGPGHRLAAGSALTQHQHVAAAWRDPADEREHFADRRRGAEDTARGQLEAGCRFRLRNAGGVRELPGVGNSGRQIVFTNRPADEIGDAEAQRFRRGVGLAAIRNADDGNSRALHHRSTEKPQRLRAREIEDDHQSGIRGFVENRARLRGLLDPGHRVAAALEHFRQSFPLSAFRRDEQNGGRHAHFTRTCFA